MENPEGGSCGHTRGWQGREDVTVPLCWAVMPSERLWGGLGGAGIWDWGPGEWGPPVKGGDKDSGGCADGETFPEPFCRGKGHLGDR